MDQPDSFDHDSRSNQPNRRSGLASFDHVYVAERARIHARRASHETSNDDLRGLALSGGGIRSATTSLGVLQRLNDEGLLDQFDYLSTVSGGGFTGSWWTAWLTRRVAPGLFPRKEVIEPKRGDVKEEKLRHQSADSSDARQKRTWIPDSSLSAGIDPIHHLRLFSNYLTPVKGAFSSDVWRAITIVVRNLLLTWLALVPLLFAAVLVAQLYFTLMPRSGEQYFYPDGLNRTPAAALERRDARDLTRSGFESYFSSSSQISGSQLSKMSAAPSASERQSALTRHALFDTRHSIYLSLRLIYATAPVAIGLGWLFFLIAAWLQTLNPYSRRRSISITLVSAVAGVLPLWGWLAMFKMFGLTVSDTIELLMGYYPVPALSVAGLWLLGVIGMGWFYVGHQRQALRRVTSKEERVQRADGYRNLLTRVQVKIAIGVATAAVLLGFGGFGHELINFTLSDAFAGLIAKAGGLTAIVTGLYTALRNAPRGGSEAKNAPTGKVNSAIFAAAPPLVLLFLLSWLSWAGHTAAAYLAFHPLQADTMISIALTLNGVALWFAFRGMRWDSRVLGARRPSQIAATLFCFTMMALGVAYAYVVPEGPAPAIVLTVVLCVLLIARLRIQRSLELRREKRPAFTMKSRVGAMTLSGATISALAIAVVPTGQSLPAQLPLFLFAAAMLLLVIETIWGGRTSIHAVGLAAIVALALAYIMICPAIFHTHQLDMDFGRMVAGLISLAFGLVVLVGGAADPNAISLHTFYKARLVRAYLGASNVARIHSQIGETHANDDIPLKACADENVRGPYHIINTTLNLVGAKDLATIQRNAASFVLTPLYCGSSSTGYRKTDLYMDGTLSLGTAAAISGAAASPNMGTKSISSSVAMLLSLLNVRLGFWAPNPDSVAWRKRQPKLWPYYILRETMSETTELEHFVYLSDGGHFDNTGLYSLIERGCKYIVLCDNGADPNYEFDDLGSAVRKCRIDFGTEFEIPGLDLYKDEATRLEQGLIRGTFCLSAQHIQSLWPGIYDRLRDDPNKLRDFGKGEIVILKPHIRKTSGADVLQYSRKHSEFPQESTAQQWFSEDQFESYRQLGYEAAGELAIG